MDGHNFVNKKITNPNGNNSFRQDSDVENLSRFSFPVRETQETIEALKREVFNGKLQRFMLEEELKKMSVRKSSSPGTGHNNENLLKNLKEHEQKYQRLLTEMEEKSLKLKNAISTINYQKRMQQQLKNQHKDEMKKLNKDLEENRQAISYLENELSKKRRILRFIRIQEEKRRQRKMRKINEYLNGNEKCAEICALPGRLVTHVSAYRRKLFRVKFVKMPVTETTATSATTSNSIQNKINQIDKTTQTTRQDELISKKVLEMILKWIVMRYGENTTGNFQLEVIFSKQSFDDLTSIALVDTTGSRETRATIKVNSEELMKKAKAAVAEEEAARAAATTAAAAHQTQPNANAMQNETIEVKLSPVRLVKLVFMPFGCHLCQY